MFLDQKKEIKPTDKASLEIDQIFDDFEARSNLVGLYNLLLKIDRRVNPQLYDKKSYD